MEMDTRTHEKAWEGRRHSTVDNDAPLRRTTRDSMRTWLASVWNHPIASTCTKPLHVHHRSCHRRDSFPSPKFVPTFHPTSRRLVHNHSILSCDWSISISCCVAIGSSIVFPAFRLVETDVVVLSFRDPKTPGKREVSFPIDRNVLFQSKRDRFGFDWRRKEKKTPLRHHHVGRRCCRRRWRLRRRDMRTFLLAHGDVHVTIDARDALPRQELAAWPPDKARLVV